MDLPNRAGLAGEFNAFGESPVRHKLGPAPGPGETLQLFVVPTSLADAELTPEPGANPNEPTNPTGPTTGA